MYHKHTHTRTQPFYGPFSGTTRWADARRELLDFMVQAKINRGRHTDHLAGRHSIRTNQCPPPPSSHFLLAGCPSCCPTNSVKALTATCTSSLFSASITKMSETYLWAMALSLCVCCVWSWGRKDVDSVLLCTAAYEGWDVKLTVALKRGSDALPVFPVTCTDYNRNWIWVAIIL